MYVQGLNNYNQLCIKAFQERDSNEILNPIKNQIDPSNLNSFSTYYEHSVWVTKDGDAFGIGNNSQYQFDPSSKKKVFTIQKPILFLKRMFDGERFISAVCGESYTLYLTIKDERQYRLHFVDKNFNQSKATFNLKDDAYLFGGNYYAAVITHQNDLYIIRSSDYKLDKPINEKVQDVAICENFALAVTYDYEVICIPIGIDDGKKIKFRSLRKFNIQTISGTYKKAIAIASEKEDHDKYSIIEFQYKPSKQRPIPNVISLEPFYTKKIVFKFVSCSDNLALLLAFNGKVYSTEDFKEFTPLKGVPPVKFILAGRGSQTFLTTDFTDHMPNFHNYEQTQAEEEDNEEEEDDIEEFVSREDEMIQEKIEEQKNLTFKVLEQLSQDGLILQSSKIAEKIYTKVSTIGFSTFYSDTIKVKLNEKDENKYYAIKFLKNIHITDFSNFINKAEKLNNDFFHPLVIRIIGYNYDLENLEKERDQKLLEIKANEQKKNVQSDQIDFYPTEEEENIQYESYHNLDIKIKNDIDRSKSDFYYPFIVMPYFPQNLFDAIESNKLNKANKVFIIIEILMAVSHLHENGIYHQRLTPWNILISESNDAFISDVFISEFIENDQMALLKDEKAIWFIDPEIINSDALNYETDDDVSKKCHDIYSIGKLIYFILTGSIGNGSDITTFAERALLQYRANNSNNDDSQQSENLIEPMEYTSDIPDDTTKLINSCISLSKAGRPSAQSLLKYIKSINYQLLPNVSEKMIDARMEIFNEFNKEDNE